MRAMALVSGPFCRSLGGQRVAQPMRPSLNATAPARMERTIHPAGAAAMWRVVAGDQWDMSSVPPLLAARSANAVGDAAKLVTPSERVPLARAARLSPLM